MPVNIESVNYKSSLNDKAIGYEHHKTFEMALVSKAFSMQDSFDLYHVNIGNGDVVLPFTPFVKKPILITMHGSFPESKYTSKYLTLFKNLPGLYFLSLSSAQRKPLPELNYIGTIPHGIDIKRIWRFNADGGNDMIWAGRAIKEKGIYDLPKIVAKSKKPLKLFPLIKNETPRWFKEAANTNNLSDKNFILKEPLSRHRLIYEVQKSKVFLFPIHWEEPFGLVLIESMACGTPVIAYARGSVPEVILDGVTGFIINPSPNEIRGDYLIKQTGVEGICEAIQRIYSMPEDEYKNMRKACRDRVRDYYTVEKMTRSYIEIYKKTIQDWKKKK